ncbi:hypothetical protein EVAR_94008_1 [Eumeta japonica]|uniref:RNA-directed DNA polymerase from mobile element jockey n=1 Tax=Eumeta variegata TaxID=151549 RepID=A0A4C1TPF4_EUMVA|nr:hypothetical protein EVAR_94008_1 [Eumeta japonica]
MVPEVEDRSKPDKSAAIQFKYARLGAVLGRKSKLSRRNKRTIYKMCIRTVMTYASPVFAHAAQKHYIDYRDLELPTISKYMKDASKRFFDIAGSHPNALLRAAVDYQPPHPTLSVGLSVSQVIDLSSLLHPAAANRLRPSGRNRPVTVSRHPMPRRLPPGVVHSACHAPSALTCAVRPHSVKLSKSSDLSSDSSRPTK